MEESYNIQNKLIVPYILLFKRTQYDPYLSNIYGLWLHSAMSILSRSPSLLTYVCAIRFCTSMFK